MRLTNLEIIALIRELCKVLEEENVNAMLALKCYLVTEDPTYLFVNNGKNTKVKLEIVKLDRYDILDAILEAALFEKL